MLHRLDGFRDCYKLYLGNGNQKLESNEPTTSKIDKVEQDKWDAILYWNREAYSTHCKEYREYRNWLINRNEDRVATNKSHGQKFDSKNILHLVRLIMTAEEIPTQHTINVDRSKEREYLLSIKRGELELKDIIEEWGQRAVNLKLLYDNSNLKNEVNLETVKQLELKIRKNEL